MFRHHNEEQILTIVKRGLEREGFEVLTATTPGGGQAEGSKTSRTVFRFR